MCAALKCLLPCASLLLNSRCCPTFMAAAVHSVGVVLYSAVRCTRQSCCVVPRRLALSTLTCGGASSSRWSRGISYVARRTPSFVATANDVQVGLPLQGDLHLSTQGGLGRCRPRRRRDLVVAASSNTTTGTARCPAAATARCCECPFGMVL